MNTKEIGNRIYSKRKVANFSQIELAQHAKISPSMISKYEAGKATPSNTALEKLAKALNTTPEYLKDGSPKSSAAEASFGAQTLLITPEQKEAIKKVFSKAVCKMKENYIPYEQTIDEKIFCENTEWLAREDKIEFYIDKTKPITMVQFIDICNSLGKPMEFMLESHESAILHNKIAQLEAAIEKLHRGDTDDDLGVDNDPQ